MSPDVDRWSDCIIKPVCCGGPAPIESFCFWHTALSAVMGDDSDETPGRDIFTAHLSQQQINRLKTVSGGALGSPASSANETRHSGLSKHDIAAS